MNRGILQSSPVQQMMAGNPNWWNINSMRPPTPQASPFLPPPANNLFPQYPSCYDNQEQLPESWSQLLLGRMVDEEDKSGMVGHFQTKKVENWEEQILHHSSSSANSVVNVKQEINPAANSYFYGHANDDHFQAAAASAATKTTSWSQVMPPAAAASSPNNKSCVTSFSSNMLDFTSTKADARHPPPDRSSECNSTASGGAAKKARVQSSSSSSTQSTFKVRKEKLGDRITALHQLVSPFGKTDTASVLLEAIGYIRFLQSQIEALSLPYLGSSGSAAMRQQQHSQHPVQGERNCIFPEDPGQLLNDNCMKRKGTCDQQESQEEVKKSLRSRGLCLVPVSCTLQVGSDNGADYWAPALGGGGLR
ncbi:hypothetical protein AB3S75_016871 [Citrus x aurantiifolia]